jgi:hypothetical protein
LTPLPPLWEHQLQRFSNPVCSQNVEGGGAQSCYCIQLFRVAVRRSLPAVLEEERKLQVFGNKLLERKKDEKQARSL